MRTSEWPSRKFRSRRLNPQLRHVSLRNVSDSLLRIGTQHHALTKLESSNNGHGFPFWKPLRFWPWARRLQKWPKRRAGGAQNALRNSVAHQARTEYIIRVRPIVGNRCGCRTLWFSRVRVFLRCVTLCGAITDAEISTSSPSVVTAAHFSDAAREPTAIGV